MVNKNVIWCDFVNFLKDFSGKIYIIMGVNFGVGFEMMK